VEDTSENKDMLKAQELLDVIEIDQVAIAGDSDSVEFPLFRDFE
jgi:hypothetical protein